MASYISRWYTRPKTVTHPSSIRARRRVTSFMHRTSTPLAREDKTVVSVSHQAVCRTPTQNTENPLVGPTSVFCVGVRPAVALRRPTHSDTDQTQNASVWRPSRLNSHRHAMQMRKNSPLCVVSGVAVLISFNTDLTSQLADHRGCAFMQAHNMLVITSS